MKKNSGWHRAFGKTQRQAPMVPASSTVADRFLRVSDKSLCVALEALAAAIEEPYGVFGAQELRLAVRAHTALCRQLKWIPDYLYVEDGKKVVSRHNGAVIKDVSPTGGDEFSIAIRPVDATSTPEVVRQA